MNTRPAQMLPPRQFEDPGAAAELAEGHRYRFDHLTLPMVMRDMRFLDTDPAPGDCMPAFDLPTTDGGRLRSSDLGERPVLLIFGSSTCPITDAAAPGVHELYRRFGDRVRFVVVNVREAHPGRASHSRRRWMPRWRTRQHSATSTVSRSRLPRTISTGRYTAR